ncbi:Mu-like prophage major head subunit gpT family protein [Acinetobacter johnsonii]|jgi:phage major head subunit gpT-like protein|uniref:Mu-like prophage major head subunit gpT family protein n=1 Tax=Acinetobacter johnsonii TaxID=40214 RepID=UPI00103FEA1D|nr:Mu-like prophage major head subunit gpT family protein [Acinetobacter johnsonii]QBK69394.1 head protein [Acinetobacter johnsonii]
MKINGAVISAIFLGLSRAFNGAFAAAPSQWQDIASEVPSSGKYNDYTWLSNFPGMKEWVGKKQIKKLSEYTYILVNKPYEATIAVKRDDIEDDQLGIYSAQAQGAGHSAKQWPDELVFTAVNKGFTEKCYDGKPFFATNHPVGKSGVSNKGTKKLSAASQEAAAASYGEARTALMSMKDEDGRPLNVNPNLLLVPPALEATANALINSDRLDDGKANLYKGTAKVVVVAWLTSPDAWFLLDTTKPLKPFIYQPRKKPEFVQQTTVESDSVFTEGEFKFGAEARGAAGYGHWQTAYGSDGSAA